MSGWGQLDILVTSRSVAVALGSLCGRTSRSVANSPGMSTRMEGRKEGREVGLHHQASAAAEVGHVEEAGACAEWRRKEGRTNKSATWRPSASPLGDSTPNSTTLHISDSDMIWRKE